MSDTDTINDTNLQSNARKRKRPIPTVQTASGNLKAAVEGTTKRPLLIDDIAQIKFLVPSTILFAYVDEDAIQVQASGSNDAFSQFKSTSEEDDEQDTQKDDDRQVLLFEYIDGDLKRKPPSKSKENVPSPRSRTGPVKVPEFSQKDLMKLITVRNERFAKAIEVFLEACYSCGLDPEESIKTQTQPHIPTRRQPDGSNETAVEVGSTIPDKIPEERRSISDIVRDIMTTAKFYTSQIVPGGRLEFPEQVPEYGELNVPLSQGLVDALYNAKNITKFYSHQASALNEIFKGENVVVSTSTSSGKSIIYQIPFLHRLQYDPDCRAMLVFPTKALAQDQKSSLKKMVDFMGDTLGEVLVETYDGDTPMEERRHIRDEARAILTNPGKPS
ncbi:hypothetical protein ABW19_dt0209115 [Dactylella cylindrospora]|nr:hypothetical protein ABW19_dt0209115 [Dactylella cylindrospora]